jgi:hypothetical protein
LHFNLRVCCVEVHSVAPETGLFIYSVAQIF